ncbi:MAG: hypothetical protein IKO05_00260 [Selenomonadaceae bacterium]|nr:hypothetical protein [Selenomonadaceae bacterium]
MAKNFYAPIAAASENFSADGVTAETLRQKNHSEEKFEVAKNFYAVISAARKIFRRTARRRKLCVKKIIRRRKLKWQKIFTRQSRRQ